MHDDQGYLGRQSDLAERVADSLMPGQSDVLRRLFASEGAEAPTLLWSPEGPELRSALLRRFAIACRAMADENGRVPERRFDADKLGNLRDWLMILEPDGDDFRYVFYGEGISRHYGRNMTGDTIAAFGGHLSTFLTGVYRAAARRGEWVMSIHEPPKSVFVRNWRRLIVPLFAPDGETVAKIAALNVPQNELRAGLELVPDPIFVTDADHRVVFFNRAAQRRLCLPPFVAPDSTLHQLIGICISDVPPPEDLLTGEEVVESVQLTVRGGLVERHMMTVSAAEHRGRAYYVAILRLIPA